MFEPGSITVCAGYCISARAKYMYYQQRGFGYYSSDLKSLCQRRQFVATSVTAKKIVSANTGLLPWKGEAGNASAPLHLLIMPYSQSSHLPSNSSFGGVQVIVVLYYY